MPIEEIGLQKDMEAEGTYKYQMTEAGNFDFTMICQNTNRKIEKTISVNVISNGPHVEPTVGPDDKLYLNEEFTFSWEVRNLASPKSTASCTGENCGWNAEDLPPKRNKKPMQISPKTFQNYIFKMKFKKYPQNRRNCERNRDS